MTWDVVVLILVLVYYATRTKPKQEQPTIRTIRRVRCFDYTTNRMIEAEQISNDVQSIKRQ